jgi:hypothetical protein
MTFENIIEYIGTPVGVAVVLGYGMKKMYDHFKKESEELKNIIEKKDELIEQLNEKHITKIEELVSNNIEINTLINENIRSFKAYIEKKLD